MRPFYRLETRGLKLHAMDKDVDKVRSTLGVHASYTLIMDWIRNVSGQAGSGVRIIIVLIGHGSEEINGAIALRL